MNGLNWKKAKTRELYVVLQDEFARMTDILAVVEELRDRNQPVYGREQEKIERKYPR